MARPTDGVPLMAFALDVIRKADGGEEPFVFHPEGGPLIRAATVALLTGSDSAKTKVEKLRSVLALCYVLDERHSSPKAAHALLELSLIHI